MSRDPLLEHAVTVTEEPQVCGYGIVACELCSTPIPLGVAIFVAKDEEGDDMVWTEPDVTDLEAHMMTHVVTDTEVI